MRQPQLLLWDPSQLLPLPRALAASMSIGYCPELNSRLSRTALQSS
jgi:hypothetical protein